MEPGDRPLPPKQELEFLRLGAQATETDLKSVWKALIKHYHPDRFVDEAAKDYAHHQAIRINASYDTVLKWIRARNEYDALFAEFEAQKAAEEEEKRREEDRRRTEAHRQRRAAAERIESERARTEEKRRAEEEQSRRASEAWSPADSENQFASGDDDGSAGRSTSSESLAGRWTRAVRGWSCTHRMAVLVWGGVIGGILAGGLGAFVIVKSMNTTADGKRLPSNQTGEPVSVQPPVAMAPVIVAHPGIHNLKHGTAAVLRVELDGTPPFSFMWRLHHQEADRSSGSLEIKTTLISIGTNATLTIPDFADPKLSRMGRFDVVVSNSFGSVTSKVGMVVGVISRTAHGPYIGELTNRIAEGRPSGPLRSGSFVEETAWFHQVDGVFSGTPVVANSGLVIAQLDSLAAFDPETGQRVWSVPLRPTASGFPVLGPRNTVLAAGESSLLCVEATTGSKLWEYSANRKLFFCAYNPVTTNVVIGGVGGIEGISTNGEALWKTELEGDPNCIPAIDGAGTVFVKVGDWTILALDGQTGAVKWGYHPGISETYELGRSGIKGWEQVGELVGANVITNVFENEEEIQLIASRFTLPRVREERDRSIRLSSPVIYRNTVIVGCGSVLCGLSRTDGSLHWAIFDESINRHTPVIDGGGNLWFQPMGRYARISNPETGEISKTHSGHAVPFCGSWSPLVLNSESVLVGIVPPYGGAFVERQSGVRGPVASGGIRGIPGYYPIGGPPVLNNHGRIFIQVTNPRFTSQQTSLIAVTTKQEIRYIGEAIVNSIWGMMGKDCHHSCFSPQ